MKKTILLLILALLVLSFTACGGGGNDDDLTVIRVGVVGAWNDHWYTMTENLLDEGIQIELVLFSDFATPNRALSDGDLDLNAFQHKMFLASEIESQGYEIEYIADTFVVPMNIFPNTNRISSLEDIQDGHSIGIPSDPTNGGRALQLLEAAGLIVLNTPEGANPTRFDIDRDASRVHIEIVEAEAALLASMLPDLEAAVIGGINAFTAGLRPIEDSIFREDVTGADHLVNTIVARSADLQDPARRAIFDAIVRAHHTDEIRETMLNDFGGAFIPVW